LSTPVVNINGDLADDSSTPIYETGFARNRIRKTNSTSSKKKPPLKSNSGAGSQLAGNDSKNNLTGAAVRSTSIEITSANISVGASATGRGSGSGISINPEMEWKKAADDLKSGEWSK
jgi:hypothetical protein